MPGDLHSHSTFSDGSVPIGRLPLMASRLGIGTLAVSDHDTLLSVRYAYDHPVQEGVCINHRHRAYRLRFCPQTSGASAVLLA